MRQLVQLKKQIKDFKKQNVEIIVVFREEEKGQDGLKKVKQAINADDGDFTLALDLGAKQTAKYSSGKMEFDNYVIDSQGKIRAIIDGTLRKRSTPKQFLEALQKLNSD